MNNAEILTPFFVTPEKNSDQANIWGSDGDRLAVVDGNLAYDVEAIDVANFIADSCNSHKLLLDALEDIEWIMVDGKVQCPSCLKPRENGHGILCKIDEALRPTAGKAKLRAGQNKLYKHIINK